MEDPVSIDELREEVQQLRKALGKTWKDKVRAIDEYYCSGQGLLDMNAVRDKQANYVRTIRLVKVMRAALTGNQASRTIMNQGLRRPGTNPPQSLQEKYPAAHKAQQEAQKLRGQRASTAKADRRKKNK